jgi:CxxC-x17-CxxC domain-containing protein
MPDYRQKNYSGGGNRNFRGDRGNFRDRDRGNRNYGDRDGNKEMFDAVCDDCGRNCQVPFQPTSGKPIFCSDCFRDKRDGDERPSRGNFNTHQSAPSNSSKDLSALNSKLDKIISLLERQLEQSTPKPKETAMIVKPEMAIVEEKPKAIAKKKVVAKKSTAKKTSAKKTSEKKTAKKSKYLEE